MKRRYLIPLIAVPLGMFLSSGAIFDQVKPVKTSESFANEVTRTISNYENTSLVVNAITPDALLTDEGSDGDVILYAIDDENKSHFIVEEFIKYDNNPTQETIKKITKTHIPELEKIRLKAGMPIIIRSASRTKEHELKRGRSGKSQHIYPNGKGAVDVSVPEYMDKEKLNKLEQAIITESSYTRISRYKSYLHLDFKPNRYGRRAYYRNTPYGWMYVGAIN